MAYKAIKIPRRDLFASEPVLRPGHTWRWLTIDPYNAENIAVRVALDLNYQALPASDVASAENWTETYTLTPGAWLPIAGRSVTPVSLFPQVLFQSWADDKAVVVLVVSDDERPPVPWPSVYFRPGQRVEAKQEEARSLAAGEERFVLTSGSVFQNGMEAWPLVMRYTLTGGGPTSNTDFPVELRIRERVGAAEFVRAYPCPGDGLAIIDVPVRALVAWNDAVHVGNAWEARLINPAGGATKTVGYMAELRIAHGTEVERVQYRLHKRKTALTGTAQQLSFVAPTRIGEETRVGGLGYYFRNEAGAGNFEARFQEYFPAAVGGPLLVFLSDVNTAASTTQQGTIAPTTGWCVMSGRYSSAPTGGAVAAVVTPV